MLEPQDLGPADEKMLDLLHNGRVTAPYAADVTGYSLQYVRECLGRLVEHDHADKVHKGLYELVSDPRGMPSDDEVDVDVDALRDALEDARDAYREVDGNGVEEALDRMEDILDGT